MKIDGFIASLIACIGLAYLLHKIEVDVAQWHLNAIGTAGIAGIFFLYGLKLNPATLRADLANWKLHALVQLSTYFFFPVLLLPFYFLAAGTDYFIIWLALFFMACLPSTVSSSVIMVSIAKGNIPAAIFNATISGLMGIFLTPLWFGGFIATSGEAIEFSRLIAGIVFQVIIPVILGMLVRPMVHRWVDANKSHLGMFDKAVILLILFKSFAASFAQEVFSSFAPAVFVALFASDVFIFIGMFLLLGNIGHRLDFSAQDTTVAQFCGAQKSLIHGTVFASLLFPAHFPIGLMLVPVMIYHAFQLMFVSFVAHQRSKE